MPERRDRSVDVHMRDGVLRKGKPLAHSDEKGRIREADSGLRKGAELGYIDDKHRVRRRAGVLRRGESVGRIRGNAAYVGEGLLGGGLKVGYIDESGQVWQADSTSIRGRVIGRARGADPEAGLAYFLLKFAELDDAVKVLEQKVRESEDRYAFLPRVRAMQRVLPEVDALGDFDSLVRRLDTLEETCASDLGFHIKASRDAIDETVRHKPTPESILQSLREEWGLSGFVPDQADAIVGRVRGALGVINEARRAVRGEPIDDRDRRTPTIPPPPPSSASSASVSPVSRADRPERDERSRRVEQVLEATFGSVERVRDEIERMRRDPDYRTEELVDKVRTAMTSVLEAGERIVTEGASSPRRSDRADRSSGRPGSLSPLAGSNSSPSIAVPAVPPPSSTPLAMATTSPAITTALVRVETEAESESRTYVERLMKTQEAEQVFEIIDVGIERLREIDGVRRDSLGRLSKALDALRRPTGRR